MNISLDYDNTYTRDPVFWDMFISNAQHFNHTVYCVTMRHTHPFESIEVLETIGRAIGQDMCHFTGRKNKKDFMFALGISIDVWIDDNPFFILNDAGKII